MDSAGHAAGGDGRCRHSEQRGVLAAGRSEPQNVTTNARMRCAIAMLTASPGCDVSNSHPACYGGSKFSRRKIANDHDGSVCSEKCVGSRYKSIDHQQCANRARLQIDAHLSSSSRRFVKRLPASCDGATRPIRCSASQSSSACLTARAGFTTAASKTTGWPWRVITISSPSRARSISCESRFWLLRHCGCSLLKYSHQILVFRSVL
jgi:hypothetical protein